MARADGRIDDGAHIGSHLRQARELLGWSLAKAAEASGGEFKPSTISAYERGSRRVTARALYRLAELYRTPVSRLLPASEAVDKHAASISKQISYLPGPHRELLAALVEQMLRDTQLERTERVSGT